MTKPHEPTGADKQFVGPYNAIRPFWGGVKPNRYYYDGNWKVFEDKWPQDHRTLADQVEAVNELATQRMIAMHAQTPAGRAEAKQRRQRGRLTS